MTSSAINLNKIISASLEIRLGEHILHELNETSLTINILASLIVNHPGYDSNKHFNDIALVKLSQSVDLNIYTPVCLPTPTQDFSGNLSIVIG